MPLSLRGCPGVTDARTTIPEAAKAVGVTAIRAGLYHNLALLANGSCIAWGELKFLR